jgi:hypothetical protein
VRVIRGEEGVRERVDREDLANIDQPVRQSVVRFHKGPPIVVDDADTPSMNPRESYGEREAPLLHGIRRRRLRRR